MLTIRTNEQDETKFWLEQQKLTAGTMVRPIPLHEGVERFVRKECKKLYGKSRYKPSGELYTFEERPWLFE